VLYSRRPAAAAVEVLTEFTQLGIKNPFINEALIKLGAKA
jgi:hypothetical protein